MTTIRNTPREATILEFEARKSASLALWFQDYLGNVVDLTNSSITFSAASFDRSGVPTILVSKAFTMVDPAVGYALLELQASELNLAPNEYDMTVTLRRAGYSVVVLKGSLVLRQNSDWDALDEVFAVGIPPQSLVVKLFQDNDTHVEYSSAYPPNLAIIPASGLVAGAKGERGDNGTDGINGIDGADGAEGPRGPVGERGPSQVLTVQDSLTVDLTLTGTGTVANKWILTADVISRNRGTTAQRDALYGVPVGDAQEVALANQLVEWYNTDLGWSETFYSLPGKAGLTARALDPAASIPASRWLPNGPGPRGTLVSSGGQALVGGTMYSSWHPMGTGGSWSNTPSIYRDGYKLISAIPGRYDAWSLMSYPAMSGTSIDSMYVRDAAQAVDIVLLQRAVFLNTTYGQFNERLAHDIVLPPSGFVFFYNQTGSLTLGKAGETKMALTYLGPPLVSS